MNKSFAKKSFGQNFLIDDNYISRIIAALAPQSGETIIEIGAGRGALTEKLVESGANVVAIELEREMISVLRVKFSTAENFRLIESDTLKVDFSEISNNQKHKLVANLPYNISTAILQKLIEQREVFSEMILMFQREVVERIIAPPGNSERGFLSVMTEAYLDAEKLFDVPPNAFKPAPKVWSAIIKLIPKHGSVDFDEQLFRAVVSQGFMQKRKTILNNLKHWQQLKTLDTQQLLIKSDIEPNRRAETLTLDEWKRLTVNIECSKSFE